MVDANKAFGLIKDSRILAGLEVNPGDGFVVVSNLPIVELILLALFSANSLSKCPLFRNNICTRRILIIAKIRFLVCFLLIRGKLSWLLKKQKCHILLILVLFTFETGIFL
jgi:hypothetical protein